MHVNEVTSYYIHVIIYSLSLLHIEVINGNLTPLYICLCTRNLSIYLSIYIYVHAFMCVCGGGGGGSAWVGAHMLRQWNAKVYYH